MRRLTHCLVGIVWAATVYGNPPSTRRWNVLLITIDTLRADHLGCYGHPARATPALDRLAAGGIRWADASTPAPLTLPAHASLLSGLYPPSHGLRVNGRGSLGSVPTLASLLADHGYDTAAVVGSFLLDRRFGLSRGFQVYDDRMPPAAAASEGAPAAHHPERDGAAVVDSALELLPKLHPPFLLWVHLYDPHDPYQPKQEYQRRFHDPYVAEIAYADAQIERLLSELSRRQLWRATVVVAAGDHGEDRGDHGEETHGFFVYQPTLQVPLILRRPDREDAGSVRQAPASLVDVLPTLCALLGIEPPPGLAGQDLLAERPAGERALYAETLFPRLELGWSELRSLRRGRWKLIDAPRPELYELHSDPNERRNLFSERRELALRLRRELSSLTADDRFAGASPPDPETLAALRSLGYIGAGNLTAPSGDLADPKDRLAERRELLALDRAAPAQRAERLAELRRRDPANPTFALLRAQALADSGQLARAVALLQDRAPAWAGAAAVSRLYWLGKYQLALGDPPAAEASFLELLTIEPGNQAAAHLLIGILLNSGRIEAARARAAELVQARPDSALAHALVAAAERAAGDLHHARAAALRAVELDQLEPQAHRQLGLVLLESGAVEAAAAEGSLARAAELSPRDALVRYEHARALLACGRPEQARAEAQLFLSLAGGRFPELEASAARLARGE